MGGCRCTFRECENGTASRKELHYFRYPTRDPERLKKWAKNANRENFVQLSLDKLSNKVVCQEHFERKMFMNDLRDRLTKLAIPRLMPMPDDTIINVETGTIFTESESSGSTKEDQIEPVQSSSPLAARRVEKIEVLEPTERRSSDEIPAKRIKILNSHTLPLHSKLTPCEVIRIKTVTAPNGREQVQKLLNRKVYPLHSPSGQRAVKAKLLNEENGDLILSEEEMKDVEFFTEDGVQLSERSGESSSSASMSLVNTQQHDMPNSTVGSTIHAATELVTVHVVDPALSQKMDQNIHEMKELKKLVQHLADRPEPAVPAAAPAPERVVMEKGPQLTKAQLFNSIKRYLNPSMVTLLRMELFAGSAERQWKPDEKSLAVDMLSLGEQVYDYFKEEFRFRLPSKDDAKQWKESGEIDVDDAC